MSGSGLGSRGRAPAAQAASALPSTVPRCRSLPSRGHCERHGRRVRPGIGQQHRGCEGHAGASAKQDWGHGCEWDALPLPRKGGQGMGLAGPAWSTALQGVRSRAQAQGGPRGTGPGCSGHPGDLGAPFRLPSEFLPVSTAWL